MTTHIVLNGKEITNPVAKATLAFAVIFIAALVTAVVVFVLLPIIGVAVTLSVGLLAIITVAIIMGLTILIFGTVVFAWLFGPTEFRIEKSRKRK